MATRSEENESRVTRRDPFPDLEALGSWSPIRDLVWGRPGRLGRMMEDLIGERPWPAQPVVAMDCSEDEKAYVITAELPGAKRDDIHVDLQDDLLTIRGEKKSEREGKTDHKRWSERTYGSFSRSFRLPANAIADRVDASFKDGVLTITLPKAEESKPRSVSIKS